MTLRLNGSTSGYAEIDAPAVAGSNTLLLPASNGSAYQFLRNGATAGTTEFAAAITSGTSVASTSGTSIDFTSIPSYVKRITVMFRGVSTNGSSNFLFQLGDSGGIETTGYQACGGNYVGVTTSTSGFPSHNTAAVTTTEGFIEFSTIDSSIWTGSGNFASVGAAQVVSIAGSKTLSGTLDRIRITTVNGTDTFDAGSINILYE